MNINFLVLVLIALLLLVLGLALIGTIYLAAHRSHRKSDNNMGKPTDQSVDPWKEAGRRQK